MPICSCLGFGGVEVEGLHLVLAGTTAGPELEASAGHVVELRAPELADEVHRCLEAVEAAREHALGMRA